MTLHIASRNKSKSLENFQGFTDKVGYLKLLCLYQNRSINTGLWFEAWELDGENRKLAVKHHCEHCGASHLFLFRHAWIVAPKPLPDHPALASEGQE